MDLIDILLGAKLGGGSGGGGSSTFVPSFGTVASVSLGTTWSGNDPYTSTVTVTGYTATDKTMVSVLPSTAVLTQMLADGTSNIYITNNNGTLTATALGAAPTQAMTLTVLCSESDQAASIGALPSIVGDGVIETLQAADLTDAVNQLGTDVSDVKNAIDQKQDAPSTAGTAGQVLGLDSNLNPVWVNQSGGGGDTSNCAPVIINTASGGIASFVDGADNRQIRKIVGTIVTAEGGSGRTGANISRSGKNLFNKNDPNMIRGVYFNRNGTIGTNVNYEISYVPVNPGDKLVYSGLKGGNGNPCGIQFFDANKTFLAMGNPEVQENNLTVTAPSGAAYIGISVFYASNVAYKDIDTAQLEIGTVASEYEPYQETTIPISWQSQAGTILNGTVTLNEDGSADVLNSDSGNSYHLANVGSLSTFLGANRLWIDTGSITECDYPADTKLYIDGLTAPDEDMIADGLIASGKYFTVNNQLYLSTAQIAAGAQIIPGSNCTATSITEALNALNS